GNAGAFQNHFQAYGRAGQPCQACGALLRSARVAGRTSTFCPRCQKA
ncbi:MAG: zinc finger domain-containing protein, partial [Humidesulfovibrio sp.]|nr:zinc finger domain-containing protein [Humidesulfovibrio sp.]